jgi:uncharacterized membrane protein YhaH (DUF805 family)
MSWFVMAWTGATDFSGRSRRKEYWMFTLINSLIGVAIMLPCLFVPYTDFGRLMNYLILGFGLVSALPSWSCSVRRLHDTGRSGWWMVFYMIPFIGLIVLVFLALDSEPGRNQYGPNPKSPQQFAWASNSSGAPAGGRVPPVSLLRPVKDQLPFKD